MKTNLSLAIKSLPFQTDHQISVKRKKGLVILTLNGVKVTLPQGIQDLKRTVLEQNFPLELLRDVLFRISILSYYSEDRKSLEISMYGQSLFLDGINGGDIQLEATRTEFGFTGEFDF